MSSRRSSSRWARRWPPRKGASQRTVDKDVIRTESAPAPFQGAPYNQAIRVGDLVFVAGQLGLAPGATTIDGDAAAQTEQVMRNLAAILEAAGTGLDRLVKTTVFLQHL